MNLINVIPEKCTGCNACIRTCPVIEANVVVENGDGTFHISVNPDKCINCGECTRTCGHGARTYNDDTKAFMELVGKVPLAILVAPAIKTVLPNQWQGVLNWFKRQGVKVYDTSFGADICTWAHLRAIEHGKVGNIISQPCAAIVNYIEMYHPELLDNLSPIHSPVMCEAIYLQKVMGVRETMAMISPCIAKKSEFAATGLIEYNVTINKLMEYFRDHNINIAPEDEKFEYDFQGTQGLMGSIYPRPGGLRDTIWIQNPDINITNSEGVNKVYSEIDEYARMPDFKHPEVFDVLSCEFGCNAGPASGTKQLLFDIMANMRDIEKSARKKRKTTGFFKEGADKLFRTFDDTLNMSDYMRRYDKKPPVSEKVSDAQLEEAYQKLEKLTPEQRSFNCHACGYKSCSDMAFAIAAGCNIPDNCIVFAKKALERKHDTVIENQSIMAAQVKRIGEISYSLTKKADSIRNITEKTANMNENLRTKADNVSMIIRMLVSYCSDMESMDKATLDQLLTMLNRVVKPLDDLVKKIDDSTKNSESVNADINEIMGYIHDLDHVLVN